MDDASSVVLDQIVRALAPRPALILLTRREGDTGYRLTDAEHTHTVTLGPLSVADAERAVVAATDDAPLRTDDVAVLAERAAGNPLFLGELLETLRDGGDVVAAPGQRAGAGDEPDRPPRPGRRAVVRMAAVLGQSFLAEELAALSDEPLPTDSDEFWRAFDGVLMVDRAGVVAIPPRRRPRRRPTRSCRTGAGASCHARAGDAIAAEQGDRPEAEAELLSLHYFHANRFDDAWRFARIAATRAVDKYANVEAAVLFDRAVNAARRGADVNAVDLADVWEQLGDVTERAGVYDRALRAYRTARRLHGDDAVAVAGLFLKEARIIERTGRYSEAVRAVRKGLKCLGDEAEPEAAKARARLQDWYATLRQNQGRTQEAVRECLAAIETAVAFDDPSTEAHARYTLDWIYVSIGQPERAVHSERALELYTELDDLAGQAAVSNNLGAFAYYDGRWDEAVELYEKTCALHERTGNAVDAAIGMYNIGEVLIDQSRFDLAQKYIDEADRVWRASDYRGGIGIAQMQLARLEAARGDFDAAFERFASARQTLVEIHADSDVVEVDLRTAECLLAAGDHRAAGRTVDATLRRDEALGGVIDHAPLLRVLAAVLAADGDFALAEPTIMASLEEAKQRAASFEVARALEVLADIERRTDRADVAAIHAAEAREHFRALGVVVPDPS